MASSCSGDRPMLPRNGSQRGSSPAEMHSGWLPARTLSLLGAWHLNVHPHQTVIGTRERKGFNQRKQRIDTGRPEDRCIGEPWGSGGCAAINRYVVGAGSDEPGDDKDA